MGAKRRGRSEFTKAECVGVITAFAKRVDRWCETSAQAAMHSVTEPPALDVVIRVYGAKFGFAENFFEAMRVLAGHQLPALPRARTGLQGVRSGHGQNRRKGSTLRTHSTRTSAAEPE